MAPHRPDKDTQESNTDAERQAVKEYPAVAEVLQNNMADRFVDDVREKTANGTVYESPAVLCDIQQKDAEGNTD